MAVALSELSMPADLIAPLTLLECF